MPGPPDGPNATGDFSLRRPPSFVNKKELRAYFGYARNSFCEAKTIESLDFDSSFSRELSGLKRANCERACNEAGVRKFQSKL